MTLQTLSRVRFVLSGVLLVLGLLVCFGYGSLNQAGVLYEQAHPSGGLFGVVLIVLAMCTLPIQYIRDRRNGIPAHRAG